MIPLTRPYMTDAMIQAVGDVLRSGMLSEGAVTAAFEQAVADYVGARHAVACCNCTAGLELALRALGLAPGDEVIVPDFTYPATANAVLLAGGSAVLADVDPDSFLLTPDLADAVRGPKTRAVMPVPCFGQPLQYDAWAEWSRATGIPVIEDAAPALGATWGGKHVGSFSAMTVFSFHPRKNMTTGEGGMILTDNARWADFMRSFKRFGISAAPAERGKTVFSGVGANYKLSDILAALGIEQLKALDAITETRRTLAQRYISRLRGRTDIRLPAVSDGHCWQTFCIFVEERDALVPELRARGVEAQIGTYALHREPAYRGEARVRRAESLDGARFAHAHTLALPLYCGMTETEQDTVLNALEACLDARRS